MLVINASTYTEHASPLTKAHGTNPVNVIEMHDQYYLYSILDCHMCGSPEQKPNVIVSHHMFCLHHHTKSVTELPLRAEPIHTLHRSIRYSCIHKVRTGPALNRSLATHVQCFECDVTKRTDGIISISICDCHMYVFYQLTGASKTEISYAQVVCVCHSYSC